MLEIEMTHITRQLKYNKLQLKYPENITHNIRRTSYTHTWIQPCSCNFLCNQEGSIAEMVIREVVEAKYKADKTIVPDLLCMYVPQLFCIGLWINNLPQQISKSDALVG